MKEIRAFPQIGTTPAMLQAIRNQSRNHMKAKAQGVYKMDKHSNSVREIGQLMSVALAALLFGSTLILAAVGPARASEAPMLASDTTPMTLRYLA